MAGSEMVHTAVLSDDGLFRYSLCREVAPLHGEGRVAFVMLNPSTADAQRDDPTLRRCIGFARDWGFRDLVVLNLYAFRATDPHQLSAVARPVGPRNLEIVSDWLDRVEAVVCAWGAHVERMEVSPVLGLLSGQRGLWCLGTTKKGHPRHPLYVKRGTELVRYRLFSETG